MGRIWLMMSTSLVLCVFGCGAPSTEASTTAAPGAPEEVDPLGLLGLSLEEPVEPLPSSSPPERRLPQPATDPEHERFHSFWSVSFSPDGGELVLGAYFDTVFVWDAAMGRPRLTLTTIADEEMADCFSCPLPCVTDVAYRPDGRAIGTISEGGGGLRW